jgi:hypothetical protein
MVVLTISAPPVVVSLFLLNASKLCSYCLRLRDLVVVLTTVPLLNATKSFHLRLRHRLHPCREDVSFSSTVPQHPCNRFLDGCSIALASTLDAI